MAKKILIDPVTRLEGHGKIHLLLDDAGKVERAYFQAPDFKGFEKFCQGRACEEMPALTQKICGVCPVAHHTASSKALDALFHVEPPPAAVAIRELAYNAFVFEDHLLHFFFLGGPDFIVGPDAPASKRNFFGVVEKLGRGWGKRIVEIRNRARQVTALVGGAASYPVYGVAGGVLKPLTEKNVEEIRKIASEALAFATDVLDIFEIHFLKNKFYMELLRNENYRIRTYSMGTTDEKGRANFYGGRIRVTGPDGSLFAEFAPEEYREHLAERVEPGSYGKPVYLKKVGWKGYREGKESGIFRVGPLARLNVADSMATPLAQAEFERMYDVLGQKPSHGIYAYHWARIVEVLCAAETMVRLSSSEELAKTRVRNPPEKSTGEGVGACEAPRGILFHHYRTDSNATIEKCNLIVATQNNLAAINMAVEKVAKSVITNEVASVALTNLVETAFRAFDPCMACATHTVEIGAAIETENDRVRIRS